MDARTEENVQRLEVEADLMDHHETMIDQTIYEILSMLGRLKRENSEDSSVKR